MQEKIIALIFYSFITLNISFFIPLLRGKILFINAINFSFNTFNKLFLKLFFWSSFFILIINNIKINYYYLIFSLACSFLIAKNSKNITRSKIAIVFLGLIISTKLPWWSRHENGYLLINNFNSIASILIIYIGYRLLEKKQITFDTFQKNTLYLIYFIFSISVIFVVLFLGLNLVINDNVAWHHWGAYIGPAQLVLAGVLPLHDIPLQYGFGPTMLLAASCKINCWSGMYWITSLATIILTFLVAWIALFFTKSRNPYAVAITLLIVFVSCLLWTSAPRELFSSISTPSTTGIRFLPSIIMLTYALVATKKNNTFNGYFSLGHIVWLLCIFWSPEAAIHASLIWLPLYVWTRTYHQGKKAFFESIAILIAVFILGLSLFSVTYKLFFSEWPIAKEYIVYLLYPPGPLPIKWNGTLIFAVACFLVWVVAVLCPAKEDKYNYFYKASWLTALMLLANFTYYLGRSHDNNILNLMPYLCLLLFATRSIAIPASASYSFATILLVATLGFTTFFGFNRYQTVSQNLHQFRFSSDYLVDSFKTQNKEIEDAIRIIQSFNPEQVEVLEPRLLIRGAEIYPPWGAIHGPANYVFFPANLREKYIENVATRLNKPGWILYSPKFKHLYFIDDYLKFYRVTNELKFGNYIALHLEPKNQPLPQKPNE